MRRYLALLPLLFWAATPARADDILMKGGGRLSGTIVERTPAAITVEVDAGRITVPAAAVESIVPGASALATYEQRAQRLGTKDVTGWLDLGIWARDHDLSAAAQRAFEHVLLIDPGNALANRALGNVSVNGRWLSADEAKRASGLVRFEGEWMTQAEQQARLAERRLDADQALARQQAAARQAEAQSAAEMAQASQPESAPWDFYGLPYDWGPGFVTVAPSYGFYGGFHRHASRFRGGFRRGLSGGRLHSVGAGSHGSYRRAR